MSMHEKHVSPKAVRKPVALTGVEVEQVAGGAATVKDPNPDLGRQNPFDWGKLLKSIIMGPIVH